MAVETGESNASGSGIDVEIPPEMADSYASHGESLPTHAIAP